MQRTEPHKPQLSIKELVTQVNKTLQSPSSGKQARIAVSTEGLQRAKPVPSLGLKKKSIYNKRVDSSENFIPENFPVLSIHGENALTIWEEGILKYINAFVYEYNESVDSSHQFKALNGDKVEILSQDVWKVTEFISWVLMPKISRTTKNPFSNKEIIFAHSLKDRQWTIKFVLIYLKNLLRQSNKLIYSCNFIQTLLTKEKEYKELLQSKKYIKFKTTEGYQEIRNDFSLFKSILLDSVWLFKDTTLKAAKEKPTIIATLQLHVAMAQRLTSNREICNLFKSIR